MAVILAGFAPAAAGPLPFPAGTGVEKFDLTPNRTAKVAEPSDDVVHPGVITEWWYANFMDPVSRRQIIVAFVNAPVPVVAGVLMYADGSAPLNPAGAFANGVPGFAWPTTFARVDGRPGVRNNLGGFTFDPVRKAYHLTVTAPFDIDVWFDGKPLPGATGIIDLKHLGEWMGWTSPVASSTVRGHVRFPGSGRIDVTGWRGYHDHNWGNFTMVDQVADGWEWAGIHEPDGGASVLGGLVRWGGEWTGSLVDVRPEGTRVCSTSTIELSDWTNGPDYLHGATFAAPKKVVVTCGPHERYHFSKTFTAIDPIAADGGVLALTAEAPYKTVPGSFGLYEHVRSFISRLAGAGVAVPGR